MLDSVMPRFEVSEYHETIVNASCEAALEAALSMPAASDRVVALLFWLRGIGGGRLPLRDFARLLGFAPVVSTERAFVGLADAGGIRFAIALWAEPLERDGARLATETRVQALSPLARITFRLYWLVVGPFSALIRRRWLREAKRRAERS